MEKLKENKNLIAAVEAILFVYGEPLEIKRIAKIIGADEKEVKTALDEFAKKLEEDNRGLTLIRGESGPAWEKVQLATKKEFTPLLENFIKEEFKENLSPASLETLSLIAYLGPIPRSEIDYYRGVNSSFILRSLLLRGLIDRFPDPKRGNAFLYQPSFDLLKYLGLSKVEEMPEYDKFKAMIAKIDSSTSLTVNPERGRRIEQPANQQSVSANGQQLET